MAIKCLIPLLPSYRKSNPDVAVRYFLRMNDRHQHRTFPGRSYESVQINLSVNRRVHDFLFCRFQRGEFLDYLALPGNEDAIG